MRCVVLALLLMVPTVAVIAGDRAGNAPLNTALAETANNVTISIPKTGSAMDGGSILNDVRFSDGRLYTLDLKFPLDIATNKLIYPDTHFFIFVPDDWANRETLEHGSAAERRLVELLDDLISTTKDAHQKKNATTLVTFLKDRKRGFPQGKRWWDFTPWTVH
jgi:hypothetical protein